MERIPASWDYGRLRTEGWTFQAIADKYGVSRQAVFGALNYKPTPPNPICPTCNRKIPRNHQPSKEM